MRAASQRRRPAAGLRRKPKPGHAKPQELTFFMSLIFQVLSWPTFGIALGIWGFAPGALLRLIVLAFHRDDPRRHELVAELYAVPRVERPFWVIEQLARSVLRHALPTWPCPLNTHR